MNETVMTFAKTFLVGGALCLVGQLLIDLTRLTPARILTGYVVAGVILGGLGLYQPLADWAGAGATVPLTGFGNLLAKGVKEAVAQPPRGAYAPPSSSACWRPASSRARKSTELIWGAV